MDFYIKYIGDPKYQTGVVQNNGEIEQLLTQIETTLFNRGMEVPQIGTDDGKGGIKISAKQFLSNPRNTVEVDTHIQLIQRIQKLELTSHRLLTDMGKVGDGYGNPMPTQSEIKLQNAQKA